MAADISPPVPIDPAEALVVITGLEPLLRHTKRDFGSALVQADGLQATIEAKIYRFINRDDRELPADLPAFDFDDTVKLLDEPDTDGIEKTLAAFGEQHDLALAVGGQVTRIHQYVRSKIPRRVHMTLAGPEPVPPAPSDLFRFRRLWTLAKDPLSLLADLQEYAISRDQVAAFADMFPSTWATFWPATQAALVRKGTVSAKWTLPRQKELLLRILCKQEAQSLVLARALADLYAAEQAGQKAQAAKRTKTAISAATESTSIQRLDAAS